MGGVRRKATYHAGPRVIVSASPPWTHADVVHPATVGLQLELIDPYPAHAGRAVVATMTVEEARALHADLDRKLRYLAAHAALSV